MTALSIARLKITLNDVKPKVHRRIEVPLSIRLDRLHLVFQAAMGWTNSYLYEIRARGVGWGMPMQGADDDVLNAARAHLVDVLEDTGAKTLKYLYDFGDGWEHTVKLERIVDAAPGLVYPMLIEGEGRCPPEDCGGPWGYADLLEVLADPDHERHGEMTEWVGRPFDAAAPAIDVHQRAVAALARKWAPKPVGKRSPAK